MSQTTVCTRIPEQLEVAVEAAAESEGLFRSELVRRALDYYVTENPDGIPVFEQSRRTGSAESKPTSSQSGPRMSRTDDPMEELGMNTDT